MAEIPDDHPRAESLRFRHSIIEGMHQKVVAEAGLIAHGRGEAFDYLIGEETHDFAVKAMEAAIAKIKTSKHPIMSVNGNIAALCPKDIVEFCKLLNVPMEINIFYRQPGRIEAITKILEQAGGKNILGIDLKFSQELNNLSSFRRIVDTRGIGMADTVIVPLEDGDRTEALKALGKSVITIDLNPLSRTSKKADITIIDNVVRAFPKMIELIQTMNTDSNTEFQSLLMGYDNNQIIASAMSCIANELKKI